MGPVESLLRDGQLRAIAVTGPSRLPQAPDVPTIGESAIPGYEFMNWYGLTAPAGTPEAIIARLNADLRRTMQAPEVRNQLASLGGDLTVGSPAEFGAMLRDDIVRWNSLVKATGLQIE